MALRGLNTAAGRVPSRRDWPKCFGKGFRPGAGEPRALGGSFFAEYPHAVLWLFRLAFPSRETVESWGVPAAVFDACFPDLVTYTPEEPNERYLWRRLRMATNVYRVGSTVCLLLLILLLQRGFPGRNRLQAATILLVLPAALYFAVNRFDVLPALLTALSLTCLARGRCGLSGIALGLATAVKVYPILLAPFVVRWLWPAPQRVARWTSGFVVTLAAMVGSAWLVYGNEGLMAPYAFQLQRTPGLMWIYYGHVLPYSWALDPFRSTVFRIVSLSATIIVLLLPSLREIDQLLRRGAIVLVVFTSLQLFWSPQWLLWLHRYCFLSFPVSRHWAGCLRPST
jgi:Glycosyltransferase family 87